MISGDLKDWKPVQVLFWTGEGLRTVMRSKFWKEHDINYVNQAKLKYDILMKVIGAMQGGTQPQSPYGRAWLEYYSEYADYLLAFHNLPTMERLSREADERFRQQCQTNRDLLYTRLITFEWVHFFEPGRDDMETIQDILDLYEGRPPFGVYEILLEDEWFYLYEVARNGDDLMVNYHQPHTILSLTAQVELSTEVRVAQTPLELKSPEQAYWSSYLAIRAKRWTFQQKESKNAESDGNISP
jgi:hypothetical protein